MIFWLKSEDVYPYPCHVLWMRGYVLTCFPYTIIIRSDYLLVRATQSVEPIVIVLDRVSDVDADSGGDIETRRSWSLPLDFLKFNLCPMINCNLGQCLLSRPLHREHHNTCSVIHLLSIG